MSAEAYENTILGSFMSAEAYGNTILGALMSAEAHEIHIIWSPLISAETH